MCSKELVTWFYVIVLKSRCVTPHGALHEVTVLTMKCGDSAPSHEDKLTEDIPILRAVCGSQECTIECFIIQFFSFYYTK